ncbi:MAG TPA: hypothetical protein DEH78_17300 [Solibacterales bacterium]|nr:hypothetical protein [Bryobacterales bacterium]
MKRCSAVPNTWRIVAGAGVVSRFCFREPARSIVKPNTERLTGEYVPQHQVLIVVRIDISCAENQPDLRKRAEDGRN